MRELGDLQRRRVRIGRVRVRHGLDDNRVTAADRDAAHIDGHRRPPPRSKRVPFHLDAIVRGLEAAVLEVRRLDDWALSGAHCTPPPIRAISKYVIQIRNANRKPKPTRYVSRSAWTLTRLPA